jgi:AraC family transcriptional regulator of adaptative response/methylated-DNA-[protein]-cysteine methyltransferase
MIERDRNGYEMIDTSQETPSYATADSRWAAVVSRDVSATGHFVLAVRTTGIYCRPGCPAKTPLRKNVVFYDSPAQAVNAGFRPCKRCKPTEPSLQERNIAVVAAACDAIENSDVLPTLDELAAGAGLSKHHFHRTFKTITGLTPGQYARSHRANRVRQELPNSPSVTQAIYETGYGSSGRFYSTASTSIGMTPTTYRARGTGEKIRFAIAATSLGPMLVAATGKGVCSIAFGDDPEALIDHLQQQFTNAELIGADPEFEAMVASVVASVEHPATSLDLPLDLRGTAFQHRVWNALRDIPAGATCTYSEVAELIGSPTSVRAVARACATNAVAVAVPCHRVVRKNGELGGYRWGLDRKSELLARESSRN